MGDPSELRFIPASSATTPIDWTKVPEDSKKVLRNGWGHDWNKREEREALPANIGELATWLDESKFFGYMTSDVCKLLMDISEFGLATPRTTRSRVRAGPPRFYMLYLEQLWVIVFAPGARDCITANSERIPRKNATKNSNAAQKAAQKAQIAKETALAQEYDEGLEGALANDQAETVSYTKRLGGWEASMMRDNMQEVQRMEAMMGLPGADPALIFDAIMALPKADYILALGEILALPRTDPRRREMMKHLLGPHRYGEEY